MLSANVDSMNSRLAGIFALEMYYNDFACISDKV